MNVSLADLAHIRLGPYLPPDPQGNVPYLQVKNFNDRSELATLPDTMVTLERGQEGHLLREGDVLFVGKGFRQFAWAYDPAIGPAVASSIFFVIRPDPRRLLGAYLAAFFNTPAALAYFAQLSAGTNIPSIRKSELEAFELPLPTLQHQQQIVKLHRLYERTVTLRHRLAAAQDLYFQTLLQQFIQSA